MSVVQQGDTLNITLATTDPTGKQATEVSSRVPSPLTQVSTDLAVWCAASGGACANPPALKAEAASDGAWLGVLLASLLPVLLIGVFLYFMFRQAQGTNNQAMSFGKSRARMFLGNKTVVTFGDVAGVDEAKTELQEVVEFLKYPEKFNSLGARIPRGVLLVGPPGTGKTLLARAVAGEAGVPFFSISGSEFVEMFVGVGASRVRDLFDQAKRNSPCIVFVDEIDAVGRQRGAGLGGSHDEREQTLNQILVEMDGFDTNTNVIVVAATNRPDVLDPALLRPGRFDRQVILDRPDMKGRLEILKVHIKGKPLDKAIDLPARRQAVAGLLGRGPRQPRQRGRHPRRAAQQEGHHDLRVQRGARARRGRPGAQEPGHQRRREERSSPTTKAATPWCSASCPSATRWPRSASSAAAWPSATRWACRMEDRYLQSKAEFEDKIAGMLGGNASERLIFGDTTTGSSNDIEKATNVARRMVTEFGMSDRWGRWPSASGKRWSSWAGTSASSATTPTMSRARSTRRCARSSTRRTPARPRCSRPTRTGSSQLAELLVAKETIEPEEFDAMFADLPDPRKDAGSGGGITSLPLHQREEPPAEPRATPQPNPAPQPA